MRAEEEILDNTDYDEDGFEDERYSLALGRLKEISSEHELSEPYGDYFRQAAAFAVGACEGAASFSGMSLQEKRELNRSLYECIMPENYGGSWLDPAGAVKKVGEDPGRELSYLFYELLGLIPLGFEGRKEEMCTLMETLLLVYNCFIENHQDGTLPSPGTVRNTLYHMVSDLAETYIPLRVRQKVDPDMDFALRIVMESNLSGEEYLYSYGEWITENEVRVAAHMAALPQETIDSMAFTYVDGYVRGFALTGKDIKKKKTVDIRYPIGYERMIRSAVRLFEKEGLRPVIYRAPIRLIEGRDRSGNGYFGAGNRQCEHDHSDDIALFLDRALVDRRLALLEEAYSRSSEWAAVHGGPAVLESFGDVPFMPEEKGERCTLSLEQEKLFVRYSVAAGQIVNRYIPRDERSYTIISYPDSRIGSEFEAIFEETIRLNSLDFKEYQSMQQAIIDVLDPGVSVHILGRGGNETDLTVALRKISDPEHETQFENCTADVNIPVGEVFTTPVLKGTNGLLHLKRVYLDGVEYRDLRITVRDGFVKDYSCANYEDPAKGRKMIFDNILHGHETLPMGEFAIGTNTTAYAMARKYDIFDRLQILIAEKTGPHFAFGDSCYSRCEDLKVYNPNGKEIISRENDCSLLRNTQPDKAYFYCHTDITIPYEELGSIRVKHWSDGEERAIIENGRFVVSGAEGLNVPLDTM